MSYKKTHTLTWILSIVAFVFLIADLFLNKNTGRVGTLFAIGFGLIIITVVISLIFSRCPYCGVYLRDNFRGYDYCPHCGKTL